MKLLRGCNQNPVGAGNAGAPSTPTTSNSATTALPVRGQQDTEIATANLRHDGLVHRRLVRANLSPLRLPEAPGSRRRMMRVRKRAQRSHDDVRTSAISVLPEPAKARTGSFV